MKTAVEVWRSVRLDGVRCVKEMRRALHGHNILIIGLANEMLDQNGFAIALERAVVDLIDVTPRTLGFTAPPAEYEPVGARILELGYEYCPAEVGPQLALQGDAADTLRYIAMQPMHDKDNCRCIFAAGQIGTSRVLQGVYSMRKFNLDDHFACIKPR